MNNDKKGFLSAIALVVVIAVVVALAIAFGGADAEADNHRSICEERSEELGIELVETRTGTGVRCSFEEFYPRTEKGDVPGESAKGCWRIGDRNPLYDEGYRWNYQVTGQDDPLEGVPISRRMQTNICNADLIP